MAHYLKTNRTYICSNASPSWRAARGARGFSQSLALSRSSSRPARLPAAGLASSERQLGELNNAEASGSSRGDHHNSLRRRGRCLSFHDSLRVSIASPHGGTSFSARAHLLAIAREHLADGLERACPPVSTLRQYATEGAAGPDQLVRCKHPPSLVGLDDAACDQFAVHRATVEPMTSEPAPHPQPTRTPTRLRHARQGGTQ